MKNFVQKGETLTLTAPYAVNSGGGALVGSIFGVAAADYANAAEGEFQVCGVFDLTKETGASNSTRKDRIKAWVNQKIEPWGVFSPRNRQAVLGAGRRIVAEQVPRMTIERMLGGKQ